MSHEDESAKPVRRKRTSRSPSLVVDAHQLDVYVTRDEKGEIGAYRPWVLTLSDSETGVIRAHLTGSHCGRSEFDNLIRNMNGEE